jgi:hypothetical protein
MRIHKWHLLLSGLFLGACTIRFVWPWIGPDAWSPRIDCDQATFDFHDAKTDTVIEHSFVVRNAGYLALTIEKIIPGCGACMSAEADEKIVQPRSSVKVKCRLTLSSLRGSVKKHALVVTNDSRQHNFALTIQGNVIPFIAFQPEKVTINDVGREPFPNQTVDLVANDSGLAFHVIGISSGSPSIGADLETLSAGAAYRVTIRPGDTFPESDLRTFIMISTDHPTESKIVIPVLINVRRSPNTAFLSTQAELTSGDK